MRVHSGMTSYEFISELRDMAVATNSPPVIIDKIDELQTVEDLETDLEKTGEELTQAENDRDDMYEELNNVIEALQLAVDILTVIDEAPSGTEPQTLYDDADLQDVARKLQFANKALERHK